MTSRDLDHVRLTMDPKFHLKDPATSDLGMAIVGRGIELIDELGYEAFTFRKLAERIGTTEASIYRYFKSKHRLLLYVTAWYWNWLEYRVMIATVNVVDARERLRAALRALTRRIERDDLIPHIDEAVLYRVVVAESSKVYLHRDVTAENRDGLFLSYKRLCRSVAEMIAAVSPTYRYPVALISTVVESSHLQRYFSEHLPRLTDVDRDDPDASTTDFLTEMVFKAIALPA
ncbi:MAG: TetR/AcrR family transcriptional regulator [Gemmatimonadaceae bacterium]|nr:TetR/AcrR family transcriptional regulator [Gemmatimonadaceae bacterium]